LAEVFVVEEGVLVLGLGLSTISNPVTYWPGCCATVILPSCVTIRLWVSPVGLLPEFLLAATNAVARARITNRPKITSLLFISL